MTRVILVSGKGGVGKTTVAAATSVMAARCGHRTIVVSMDRAHNLGDVLGAKLGAKPAPVAGCKHLRAMEVDPQTELREHEAALEGYFARLLSWAGVASGIHADEVAVIPGLEELLMLSRLAIVIDEADADVVVVDLAPTASSLKLLSFPELMAGPLGRLAAWERRFLRIARPAAKKLMSAPIPEEATYEAIDALTSRLRALRDLLVDASRCVVRLVSIPERVVVDETRSAYTALSLFGLTVDSIVMNRVLPKELARGYLGEWTRIQTREIERARASFPGLDLRQLRFQPGEVLGVAALEETGDELYGSTDPARFTRTTPPLRFHTEKGTPTLSLSLPHANDRELDLQQRDGELIVTVGAWRRQLLLPDSLRARDVTNARFANGTLRVEFASRKEKS